MTIKEIAELCGVDQSTVNRWAHDAACKMQADDGLNQDIWLRITEKLEGAGRAF
jgi:predicted site-specific integrase-resolvase